jgi:hypothetical protein
MPDSPIVTKSNPLFPTMSEPALDLTTLDASGLADRLGSLRRFL